MSLFGKKEIKVKVKTPECACHSNCPTKEVENVNIEKTNGKTNIKILGSGCKNCHALHENTKEAVANMKIDAEIEYITDMQKIMSYGVMSMPALVVNEKVVSMGKVYKPNEVEKLFHKLGF